MYRFWIVALLAVVVDLWTKHAIFDWLGSLGATYPLTSFFSFTLHKNHGAVFGIAQNQVLLLIAVTALITPSLVWIAYTHRKQNAPLWSLGLILGGAIGNFYDRILLGSVRDFLHFEYSNSSWGTYSWPIFNIADVAISVGVFAWIIWMLFLAQDETASAASTEKDHPTNDGESNAGTTSSQDNVSTVTDAENTSEINDSIKS